MNIWKKRIILVFISVVLNVVGRYIAHVFGLPAYLDICGTILSAYFEGPVVGAVTAIISCIFCSVINPTDWYFIVANVAVGVAAGLIARKNKYFERFSLIISATAFFALVKGVILFVVNLSAFGGRSGLYIADGIIDYLGSISAPLWFRYFLTAVLISFTDALGAMICIYIGLYVYKNFGKRRSFRIKEAAYE